MLQAHDADSQGFESFNFQSVDRTWATTACYRCRRRLTLSVAEARSVHCAVKHILRTVGNHGQQQVVRSDSRTAVCAISRSCAKILELRRVCQQIGAMSLVTVTSYVLRIPGEGNLAEITFPGACSSHTFCSVFQDLAQLMIHRSLVWTTPLRAPRSTSARCQGSARGGQAKLQMAPPACSSAESRTEAPSSTIQRDKKALSLSSLEQQLAYPNGLPTPVVGHGGMLRFYA